MRLKKYQRDKKNIFLLVCFITLVFIYILKIENHSSTQSSTEHQKEPKTLIFYCYYEKNDAYIDTLKFFLEFGIQEKENLDYVLIIQGFKCSIRLRFFKNVRIIRRRNDCFDFGAYGYAIKKLGGKKFLNNYNKVIFLNPSVIGPILPKYWPDGIHWSEIFTSRLKNDVHAVGTSIVCLPEDDRGGEGPRIEGMAFAATTYAIVIAIENNIFSCKTDKTDSIVNGEYAFSKILLENNLNIDTLLLKYGNVDWRNRDNWQCNNQTHPTRFEKYEDISVHPLEVVFHKPLWDSGDSNYLPQVNLKETKKYIEWARTRLK